MAAISWRAAGKSSIVVVGLTAANGVGAVSGFDAAVERSWVLVELASERASLEDVFVRLTTRDAEEPVSDQQVAGEAA